MNKIIANNYIDVKIVEPCLRLSRWAMRMNADIGFPVSSGGRVGVPSPGLYLVYAQVDSPLKVPTIYGLLDIKIPQSTIID